MSMSIQLVFDTAEPAQLARFWAEALGYRLQPPPDGFDTWESFLREQGVPEERWEDASAIVDREGRGPRIYFQRVPEGKTANGLPFDEQKRRVDAEVARLKALGATDERGAMERDGEYWVRMNDPEGNEFCVQ
jgi:hypothetical protein